MFLLDTMMMLPHQLFSDWAKKMAQQQNQSLKRYSILIFLINFKLEHRIFFQGGTIFFQRGQRAPSKGIQNLKRQKSYNFITMSTGSVLYKISQNNFYRSKIFEYWFCIKIKLFYKNDFFLAWYPRVVTVMTHVKVFGHIRASIKFNLTIFLVF